jgi:hypothetical protein
MIETAFYVAFDHPVEFGATLDVSPTDADTVHCPPAWPETIGAFQKITFGDRLYEHLEEHLHRPVADDTDSQGAFSAFGFRYPFTPGRHWLVSATFEFLL